VLNHLRESISTTRSVLYNWFLFPYYICVSCRLSVLISSVAITDYLILKAVASQISNLHIQVKGEITVEITEDYWKFPEKITAYLLQSLLQCHYSMHISDLKTKEQKWFNQELIMRSRCPVSLQSAVHVTPLWILGISNRDKQLQIVLGFNSYSYTVPMCNRFQAAFECMWLPLLTAHNHWR